MAEWFITRAKALPGYRLDLEFEDGTRGVLALDPATFKGILAPLKDEALFAQVTIDAFGAPSWPGGLDMAPDAMHEQLKRQQAA